MLSKTIEFLSMKLVAYKKEGFSLFRLLFVVVSGLFQLVVAFYGLFRVVLLFGNVEVTEYFNLQTLNQLHVDFFT